MHAREYRGFDRPRLQDSPKIGPSENVDTALDDNRLSLDRNNGWMNLCSRIAGLEKPVLGKDGKYRVTPRLSGGPLAADCGNDLYGTATKITSPNAIACSTVPA
jgi:hypothetical protein